MMTYARIITLLCILGFCGSKAYAQGEPVEEKPPHVRMPVWYKKAMLLIVGKEGIAAVSFSDRFERGNDSGNGLVGVKYNWLFLEFQRERRDETSGNGRFYAKLKNHEVAHGSFTAQCGTIPLKWSYLDRSSGVMEFDPQKYKVYAVSRDYFSIFYQRRKQDHLTLLNYFFAEGEQKQSFGGPVYYQESAAVRQTDAGIEVFEFGEPYERHLQDRETRHGVPYRYHFFPRKGEPQRGEGEVFERYKNRRYNGGELELKAGPIELKWSRGGDLLGWVYFKPAHNPVWIVEKDSVETLVQTLQEKSNPADSEAVP